MRPLACRYFNVFDKVCEEGEDAFYTRRRDVLTPLKRYANEVLDIMLPFYGVTKKSERREALKTGAMHKMTRVMGDLEWNSLADKMDAYETRGTSGTQSDSTPAPKTAT